jgi:hypothetical protein
MQYTLEIDYDCVGFNNTNTFTGFHPFTAGMLHAVFLHEWPPVSKSLQCPHEPNSITLKMKAAYSIGIRVSTYYPTIC